MPWPSLTFEIRRRGDEVSLVVAGELDLATGRSLEVAALKLLDGPPRLLILDLRAVTFCDSSGIASLILIHRAATRAGSALQLHNVDPRVRQILDLGGVSQILGVRDDDG